VAAAGVEPARATIVKRIAAAFERLRIEWLWFSQASALYAGVPKEFILGSSGNQVATFGPFIEIRRGLILKGL
jgi:hypothetical protein